MKMTEMNVESVFVKDSFYLTTNHLLTAEQEAWIALIRLPGMIKHHKMRFSDQKFSVKRLLIFWIGQATWP